MAARPTAECSRNAMSRCGSSASSTAENADTRHLPAGGPGGRSPNRGFPVVLHAGAASRGPPIVARPAGHDRPMEISRQPPSGGHNGGHSLEAVVSDEEIGFPTGHADEREVLLNWLRY